MLMLCVSWGFNQIAVKLALPDVPPMLQATIRSAGALPVLLLIAWLRGVRLFERDGTLGPGLFAGLMFGFEFVLIYRGLLLTRRCGRWCFSTPRRSSWRSAPTSFSASGCAPRNGAGSRLSFAGVALAIGVPQADVDAKVLLGDLMIVGGGALWARDHADGEGDHAAARPRRKRRWAIRSRSRFRFWRLAAWISGETLTHVPGPLALSLLAYQAFWVVGLTFLLWFALVKTYSASKLSAFTFITPLFGVVASYFIMHDKLSLAFGAAALLVIAGLYLVNKPETKVVPDPNVPA